MGRTFLGQYLLFEGLICFDNTEDYVIDFPP